MTLPHPAGFSIAIDADVKKQQRLEHDYQFFSNDGDSRQVKIISLRLLDQPPFEGKETKIIKRIKYSFSRELFNGGSGSTENTYKN